MVKCERTHRDAFRVQTARCVVHSVTVHQGVLHESSSLQQRDTLRLHLLYRAWVSKLFYRKGPSSLLWAGSLAPREKITISGIVNCLNYCEIVVVYTQFTNVVAGRIIQPGVPRVGDPCCRGCHVQVNSRSNILQCVWIGVSCLEHDSKCGQPCAHRAEHLNGSWPERDSAYTVIREIYQTLLDTWCSEGWKPPLTAY